MSKAEEIQDIDKLHKEFKEEYELLEERCKQYEEILRYIELIPGLYKKLDYLEDKYVAVVERTTKNGVTHGK
jgi:hypothetical protein